MPNSYDFNGDFYDADYFERGRESGKGWLTNYRWMPRRSLKEAFAYIDTLGLDEKSYVLDFGTAKGFIVKALRLLEIKADGCDISDYALSFSPEGCWNCSDDSIWLEKSKAGYTDIIVKDVFEHFAKASLILKLNQLGTIAPSMMCVIPMGDNGVYRIKEYHIEISHLIAEDESWWRNTFKKTGWNVEKEFDHVSGLKDNWQGFCEGKGNHVFVLKR